MELKHPTQMSSLQPSLQRKHSTEHRGILFVISAPSGAGKTTLCKQIVATMPDLWHSISYTTRQPRPGETHGREYFFVEEAAFLEMVERHEFLESARVHGHFYGTPRKALADKMEQGIDVLLEIDVQGAMQVKKLFEDAVFIFILPPSMDVLRNRLETRGGDSPDEIQRRLQKAREEVWSYREYYYILRNDDLTRSLKELESVFLAERIKTKRLDMAWLEHNFILDKDPRVADLEGSAVAKGSAKT